MTLIPEGLVLLMSVTLAVAAVRLARQNTLVQQMAATEALAAVDTICVDKTGTLTDGSLKLIKVETADPAGPADAERALGTFAASAGERNRTLETIAAALSRARRAADRRGSVLLAVEVERSDAERLELRDRRPRRPQGRRRARATRGPPAGARRAHLGRPPGRRVRRGARWPAERIPRPSRRRGSSRGR